MKENSSSSVTSLLQGERLPSSGLFKELNTPWPGNNRILFKKEEEGQTEKTLFFFFMVWTSLDLKKVKEMLKPKLLNTLAFLAHCYLFVTLESTLYALFATFWEIAWKQKPCLKSGWCVVYFCGFLFWVIIYLFKLLSNRNPWFAVRNQSTYLFWLKRRFLSKVEKKNNETCLEKWLTTVTTFP